MRHNVGQVIARLNIAGLASKAYLHCRFCSPSSHPISSALSDNRAHTQWIVMQSLMLSLRQVFSPIHRPSHHLLCSSRFWRFLSTNTPTYAYTVKSTVRRNPIAAGKSIAYVADHIMASLPAEGTSNGKSYASRSKPKNAILKTAGQINGTKPT